jgi:membrane fusion protein, multidrug efflux system
MSRHRLLFGKKFLAAAVDSAFSARHSVRPQQMRLQSKLRGPIFLFLALATLSAVSCTKGNAERAGLPPPNVSVIEVHPRTVPIYAEYAAQTFARDEVEIRGQVDGYIRKRLFKTGSDVKAGETLYILDLRPYEADVSKAKGDVAQTEANVEFAKQQVALLQAEADLAQAEANQLKAQQDVDRLTPLVKQDAAAQQDLDNAIAALKANQANVAARKANVDQTRLSTRIQVLTSSAQLKANQALLQTAQINLEYATITSPINGRIGDSVIQVGGLVTKNSAQPLTTVVPLDPIWVRFKVSEADYLGLTKNSGSDNIRQSPLELLLADNTVFPYPGHIQDSTNKVDTKTGTLEVQATFPNPKHIILPGQFGRIRVRVRQRQDVLLVPQRAVEELQGLQSVLTVGPDNKALAHSVVLGDRTGTDWIVDQGLKPGDRVIVEGLMLVRPGSPVNPQPYRPASPETEKN